jgi:hypothetical protein
MHLSYAGKKMGEQRDSVSAIMDFKKAYDSVRREVLYSILIESGIPMKLVRLIKMCLNERYSKVKVNICLIIFLSKMV